MRKEDCVSTLGEVVKHILLEIRDRYPQVELRKIAKLWDIVAHVYLTIDDQKDIVNAIANLEVAQISLHNQFIYLNVFWIDRLF